MCDSACDCEQVPKGQPTTNSNKLDTCRKCESPPFIIIDKVHAECKGCFLESCNRKIRSTIGKSRLLKNNDSVILAHSGSSSSMALLDLIKNSINCDFRREQKLRPSLIHVDTQAVYDPTATGLNGRRLEKLKILLDYTHSLFPDWPIYWTTLEMALISSGSHKETIYARYEPQKSLTLPEYKYILDNQAALDTLIESTKSMDLTDKHQHVENYIIKLVDKIANIINSSLDQLDKFKYIFTGSSATQLANNLLVDVILGHGATIRSTVNICDTRTVVPILRPLKDFSKKELAFYLRARGIDCYPQTNFSTFGDRKESIQKATESFLSKLYVDFPSTYSTLIKMGNRMQE